MRTIFLVLLPALLALGACRKHRLESSFSEPMRVAIREIPDSAGRTQQLSFYTKKSYPCYNFSIAHGFAFENGTMQINFKEIVEPGVCLTAIGPAFATLEFRDLPSGTYPLSLYTAMGLTEGVLRVRPEQFEIVLYDTSAIAVPMPVVNRIPPNAIYGNVMYADSTKAAEARLFLDSLQALGAQSGNFLPGNYLEFMIGADGKPYPAGDMGRYPVRSFLYTYTGPMQRVVDFMNDFGRRHSGILNISLVNAKGERRYYMKQ